MPEWLGIVMFIMQGMMAIIMLLIGIVLKNLQDSDKEIMKDLRILNDAVLGRYVTGDKFERLMEEFRKRMHDVEDDVLAMQIKFEQSPDRRASP